MFEQWEVAIVRLSTTKGVTPSSLASAVNEELERIYAENGEVKNIQHTMAVADGDWDEVVMISYILR